MAEPVPVILAKEGVSDDSFLFLEALKGEGAAAEAGEAIARVETSKANIEICAPCAGHVFYRYRVGQEVPVGETIAVISADKAYAGAQTSAGAPAPKASEAAMAAGPASDPAADANAGRTRFTPLARKVMAEHNLRENAFAGPGRVRMVDVMEAVGRGSAAPSDVPAPPPGAKPRFSLAAAAEMERLGLASDLFNGAGLVTREDVRRHAGIREPGNEPMAAATPAGSGPRAETAEHGGGGDVGGKAEIDGGTRVPLSKAKRNEILSLQDGARGTLSSAITVLVSGRGFFDPAAATARPSLLPAVIYEAARLLVRFPDFNGSYSDNSVVRWNDVNVGVAFEIDAGLKVPVVKGADRLGMGGIREALDGHIMKYLESRLGIEDLTGATFTVTDLSNEKVFDFLPLINRGQSSILGIGGCQAFSENVAVFPLTLAFDHRVSTGRQASLFLRSLKERLESYGPELSASDLAAADSLGAAAKSCSQCRREEGDLRDRQYLLAIHRGGKSGFVCSTCLKGW